MSEENNQTQEAVSNDNSVADSNVETNSVPYSRFAEVNHSKKDLAGEVGKLQAQIEKINQSLGKENELIKKKLVVAFQGLKAIISNGVDTLKIAEKTLTAMNDEEKEIPQNESENE